MSFIEFFMRYRNWQIHKMIGLSVDELLYICVCVCLYNYLTRNCIYKCQSKFVIIQYFNYIMQLWGVKDIHFYMYHNKYIICRTHIILSNGVQILSSIIPVFVNFEEWRFAWYKLCSGAFGESTILIQFDAEEISIC